MLNDWDKNSQGNIWLTPLRQYQTAQLHQTGIGLRLELAHNPDGPEKSPDIAQVAMTVEQAQELITDLQLAVDLILFGTRDGPAN
jgi:hypothetical protein